MFEWYFTVTKDCGNGWRNLAPKPVNARISGQKKGPNWGPVNIIVSASLSDPCRTRCRAHIAANSRNFRDVAGVSRYMPHTTPKKTLSHPSCHLPVTVSLWAFLVKTDRVTRGCSNYTHTPIALRCANKVKAGVSMCFLLQVQMSQSIWMSSWAARSLASTSSTLHDWGTANHAPSPQKIFLIGWYFWGVVCELSEPKRRQIRTTKFCTRDVGYQLCGGGARISRSGQRDGTMSSRLAEIGNENSARSFSDRSFFEPPQGHGRPRLRVMDVHTEMLVFPRFRGLDRSFCPWTFAGISAWTSAGHPAPKLTLWAAFSFLNRATWENPRVAPPPAHPLLPDTFTCRINSRFQPPIPQDPCQVSSHQSLLIQLFPPPNHWKAPKHTRKRNTPPKMLVIDRSQDLRFRVCCVFGCSFAPP